MPTIRGRGRAWGERNAARLTSQTALPAASPTAPSPSSVCRALSPSSTSYPSYPHHPIHTASYPPAAFADEVFKANVAKHKTYYESLRAQLGIVDFNPLTVDWTTPVPWGNDPDNCKMEDSSGAARQP